MDRTSGQSQVKRDLFRSVSVKIVTNRRFPINNQDEISRNSVHFRVRNSRMSNTSWSYPDAPESKKYNKLITNLLKKLYCMDKEAWAAPGRVYTTEAFTAPRNVKTTGAWAALGLSWTTGACAAPGRGYATYTWAAPGRGCTLLLLDVSMLQRHVWGLERYFVRKNSAE